MFDTSVVACIQLQTMIVSSVMFKHNAELLFEPVSLNYVEQQGVWVALATN